MSEHLTSLGDREEIVMEQLDNVCDHFAQELGMKSDQIKKCAAHVWEYHREKARKDCEAMLSAMDYGPYGGR